MQPETLKPKLLIVDDEAEVRSVVQESLSNSFEVIGAESAPAALEILSQNEIHLVITDFNMPVVDGLEFAKMIRRQSQNLPIIMLTGRPSAQLKLDFEALGRSVFVEKPYRVKQLRSVIADILNESDF